ncbi:MAG: hypothetical protein WC545_02805 [Patescibacteria group bacterium]
MTPILNLLLLLVLFVLLGLSAELVVRKISYLAGEIKMRMFAFGILLGIITTLPELAVGINTMLNGAGGLSVGNILGGVIVILGLVLGCSLLLNRKIATDGNLKLLIPQIAIIFVPIFFGFDGRFSQWEGLVMVALYLSLVFYLYRANRTFSGEGVSLIEKNKVAKAVFLSLGGIIAVLLLSNWIVDVTLILLNGWNISKLAIGVLIFSIGTNLPEISIAAISWRKKVSELSLSHLLSSSFTNILILGLLATIRPINFVANGTFVVLAVFLGLTLTLFGIFHHSGKKLSRAEGGIMVLCYLLFLIANFYLLR